MKRQYYQLPLDFRRFFENGDSFAKCSEAVSIDQHIELLLTTCPGEHRFDLQAQLLSTDEPIRFRYTLYLSLCPHTVVRSCFPEELEELYAVAAKAQFTEPLFWLRVDFPDSVYRETLEGLRVGINCLPVANISKKKNLRKDDGHSAITAFRNKQERVFHRNNLRGRHFGQSMEVILRA